VVSSNVSVGGEAERVPCGFPTLGFQRSVARHGACAAASAAGRERLRNRALDQLRLKSERQRWREDQTGELPPVVTIPDFEGSLDEKRRAFRVHELMGSLNPQQKSDRTGMF
jgi:DNA-directed RNA polymerase specialized sigma24 family protein